MDIPDPRQVAQATLASAFQALERHPVPGATPLNRRTALKTRRLQTVLTRLQARSQTLSRPLRVLDLACGLGIATHAAARMGHRALGLDRNPEAIHWAEQQAQGSGALFWRSDLLQDPFWEQTVGETLGGKPDVILLTDALASLPQSEFFVDRISRWVGPGTWVIVSENNSAAPLRRLREAWEHRYAPRSALWHKSFDQWREQLESHGFEVDEPTGVDDWRWMEKLFPSRCSSLVFTARRR